MRTSAQKVGEGNPRTGKYEFATWRPAATLPSARLMNPPMLMTRSIGNALAAMRRSSGRRIVVLSALGVGGSFALAPANHATTHNQQTNQPGKIFCIEVRNARAPEAVGSFTKLN